MDSSSLNFPPEEISERKKGHRAKSLVWKKTIWKIKLNFNPVVTIASFALTLSVIIWIVADPKSEEYAIEAQNWITESLPWLYVASTTAWVIFLFLVYIWFGDIKLGCDDEPPDHGHFTYYCMLFTCGLSSPIFYAGVSDPIYHFNHPNPATDFYPSAVIVLCVQIATWVQTWYVVPEIWWRLFLGWPQHTCNFIANDLKIFRSILEKELQNFQLGKYPTELLRSQKHDNSVTIFLWGLHGFAAYSIFGLIIGILTHRKGLPLTLRTCFYPLFGASIFGRVGDAIDTICISSILYGISVSLVIGAKSLNSGFNVWNSDIEINRETQLGIIWVLTILSTISVVSGLNIGIKKLSQLCVLLGFVMFLILLTAHKTAHILNVVVQTFGYYAQFLVGFGLYTAAFEQRGLAADTFNDNSNWMNANTLFFWGWWISWSPFVGLFIAKISRGRTVKEVIWYSFFLPTITVFFWLITFGTIALDTEIKAMNMNISCDHSNPTQTERLSCFDSFTQTFMMHATFNDISDVLRCLTIISAIFFFITSSDSASLIIDCVSSNGEEDPPIVQRVFWAFCEGAVASALLGHNEAENFPGLKAIAVMSGFPLTFVLCFCCHSLWKVLKSEPYWKIELFKVWVMPLKKQRPKTLLEKVLIASVAPWYMLENISQKLSSKKEMGRIQSFQAFIFPCILFNSWILLLCLSAVFENVDKIGWSLFIVFLCYGANIREKVRTEYDIEGHVFADVIMMIIYPFTIFQMLEQMNKTKDEKWTVSTIEREAVETENNNDDNSSVDTRRQTGNVYINAALDVHV